MEPTGVCPRREGEPVKLQYFKRHCSLRFTPAFFGAHKAAVEAAGYEAGEGFIKLPYDRELRPSSLRR